jgi:hypothetical protein
MLDSESSSVVEFPESQQPLLVVVVDTEEEFDWRQPLSGDNTSVSTVRHQLRAHRIFDTYGIKPTYVIDYPVATREEASRPLRELLEDGRCDVGAHLHPWVNPPFDEEVSVVNSYAGNLPRELEFEKLRWLTEAIADNFGVRPTVYKAGRYGVGPATSEILTALDYQIDTSVVPYTDMRRDHGPDFRHCAAKPYWFGPERNLLEVPETAGFSGRLAGCGWTLHQALRSQVGKTLHLPGLFSRLLLFERAKLTPEGVSHAEQRRLTERFIKSGHRVFTVSYHSPSLAPGHTPYVRDRSELTAFLDNLDRYFDYFANEVGGRFSTLTEVRGLAQASRS